MTTFMASSLQFLSLAVLSFLADTAGSSRIRSSIDFHFGIVKSTPHALRHGKTERKSLKEKRDFFKREGPGPFTESQDEDFESRNRHPRECRVVLDCTDLVDYPYRTADGSCNNLRKPDWGSAFQPYRRILRPEYEDRMSTPRLRSRKTNELLPSPREVSRVFHSSDEAVEENTGITHMVMQWGQFLDHDISITPVQANLAENDSVTSLSCCPDELPEDMPYGLYNTDSFTNCFPIPISADDPAYSGKRCMSFSRSVQVRNTQCRVSPVEQLNQITAFIDASNVYGSSDDEMEELRTMEGEENAYKSPKEDVYSIDLKPLQTLLRHHRRLIAIDYGLLQIRGRVTIVKHNRESRQSVFRDQIYQLESIKVMNIGGLPTSVDIFDLRRHEGRLKCRRIEGDSRCPDSDLLPASSTNCGANSCFKAGDVRANEQTGLASMHTLFVREHNRIAGVLQDLNKHWDDEKIFHETRKIVGAMMQVITYKGFLPIVLGTAVNKFDLSTYYPSMCLNERPPDPSITNAFAAAAFRFGHSQIRGFSSKCQSYSSCPNETRLSENFGNAGSMVSNTCLMEDWLRGLTHDHCPRVDRYMSPEVTEHMFEDAEGNSLDLAALNIQRGRDHGLPGYNKWRRECHLRKFNKFSQMTQHTEEEQNKLAQLYRHPDDIDLFTAGVSEKRIKGGIVGQTFSCILGRQFQALKEGDRFWYENTCRNDGFTRAQIRELQKVTLTKVLCQNTGTEEMQEDCFKPVSNKNLRRTCEYLINEDMNLAEWCSEPPAGSAEAESEPPAGSAKSNRRGGRG